MLDHQRQELKKEPRERSESTPILRDHTYLINKCMDLLHDSESGFKKYPAGDLKECKKIGFNTSKKGNAYIVIAEDTAVELGSPENKSFSRVLWTKENGVVGKRLWIAGKDLPQLNNCSVSFLQLIIIQLGDEHDPTDIRLQSLKNLANKIPGFMTRSMPGKMWIRIHKKLFKKKITLYSIGQCLTKTYQESIPGLKGIDIILAADNSSLISAFEPIYEAAKIICGENQKLKWEEDGVVSCKDLNCDICDEKAACDTIKNIVVKRKQKR